MHMVSLVRGIQFLARTIPYMHMYAHLRFLYIPTSAVLFQAKVLVCNFVFLLLHTGIFICFVLLFSQVTQVLID